MSLDSYDGPRHVWQMDRITPSHKGHGSKGGTVFILHGVEHASCAKCAKVKPLTEYTSSKKLSTGHLSYCRSCERERQRIRHAKRAQSAKRAKRLKHTR